MHLRRSLPFSLHSAACTGDAHCARIDDAIAHFNAGLTPLKDFILPGGTRAASLAHVARTACRRAGVPDWPGFCARGAGRSCHSRDVCAGRESGRPVCTCVRDCAFRLS